MDINELRIEDKNTTYSKMIDFVSYVVSKSYDKNKMYRAYLRDYYEMISLLTMYTNYDGDYSFDEIMMIKNSGEWAAIIKELGSKYHSFHYYIECDLNRINAPLANVDSTIKSIKEFLVKANMIIDVLIKDDNFKTLFDGIDVNKIVDVIDAYNALIEAKNEEEIETGIPHIDTGTDDNTIDNEGIDDGNDETESEENDNEDKTEEEVNDDENLNIVEFPGDNDLDE